MNLAPYRWLDVPGARLAYWRSGTGPDAIVVHGGPDFGSSYLRGPLTTTLGGVVTLHHFDQRGTGRSTADNPGQTTMTQLVADLDLVRLQLGLDQPLLIAHSFGALVALCFARQNPAHVAGLVLIDPDPLCREDWEAGVREVSRLTEAHSSGSSRGPDFGVYFVNPTLAEGLELGERRPGPGIAVRRSLGAWDLRKPRLVETPTLVVTGDQSIFPARAFTDYVASIADCSLVVCSGARHFPHVEAPGHFEASVRAFIKG